MATKQYYTGSGLKAEVSTIGGPKKNHGSASDFFIVIHYVGSHVKIDGHGSRSVFRNRRHVVLAGSGERHTAHAGIPFSTG